MPGAAAGGEGATSAGERCHLPGDELLEVLQEGLRGSFKGALCLHVFFKGFLSQRDNCKLVWLPYMVLMSKFELLILWWLENRAGCSGVPLRGVLGLMGFEASRGLYLGLLGGPGYTQKAYA